jgi:hypothetical protein
MRPLAVVATPKTDNVQEFLEYCATNSFAGRIAAFLRILLKIPQAGAMAVVAVLRFRYLTRRN